MVFQLQQAEDLRVQSVLTQFGGHGVNRVDVFHGDDAGLRNVAEQRDFLLQFRGNVMVAAAKQNVRLNPDAQHFFYAVLRGLGFQFTGGGDERHQRDVHKERILRAHFQAHLADGFEEGKRLDVANRAANLDDNNVDAFGNFPDGRLDLVSDVRDYLDGFAEVITAALFGEDRFVDAAGRPVIVAGKLGVREAFIVAEIEVRLRAVLGDKHFTMLKRAHRTWINVEVRVAFLQGDFETATFEETADRGGSYALSK